MIERDKVIAAIRDYAAANGRPPSKSEFKAASGISEYHVTGHFKTWNEAVTEAGFTPDIRNVRVDDETMLEDWGHLVRQLRGIPTIAQYRHSGEFHPSLLNRRLGPWSTIPKRFRSFATGDPQWADVIALLPMEAESKLTSEPNDSAVRVLVPDSRRHLKLPGRPTYGSPIDFRGLRHEPVNEQGVVLLFGMVSRELGYLVEAVQAGYPDCEAKRQVNADTWQRVRIEFEFESRNFRTHGHALDGCDIIVCWRHNWHECPAHIEIVELQSVIRSLAKGDL